MDLSPSASDRRDPNWPVTVLLSGGIDSAACAALVLKHNAAAKCLFVDYGQPAADREYTAALGISTHYRLRLDRLEVKGAGVPSDGEIRGRNLLLLAVGLLSSRTPCSLAMGLHSGTPYYDCTQQFVRQCNVILSGYDDGRSTLVTPFIDWTKSDIVAYCQGHDVPLQLTYSCERGEADGCGCCRSCLDRRMLDDVPVSHVHNSP